MGLAVARTRCSQIILSLYERLSGPGSDTNRNRADLRDDATEEEAKEAQEPTIREACRIIERRQAQQERSERKESLIRQGVSEVARYLLELRQEDEISAEDYLDSALAADLRDAVKAELDAELTGDETAKEVRTLAREIIDGELA